MNIFEYRFKKGKRTDRYGDPKATVDSPMGFYYSWEALKPVRILATTVVGSQYLFGLIFGLYFDFVLDLNFVHGFMLGGSGLIFPMFLIGLILQSKYRPGSLGENATMVRRLGLIALLFNLIGIVMYLKVFGG